MVWIEDRTIFDGVIAILLNAVESLKKKGAVSSPKWPDFQSETIVGKPRISSISCQDHESAFICDNLVSKM